MIFVVVAFFVSHNNQGNLKKLQYLILIHYGP